jgi:hypothetical protein
MGDTRALRDRLEVTQAELRRAKEHLEKLRAHQARERESLQQQLEQARREVSELRGRLDAAALVQSVPPPLPDEVPPEPAVAERWATGLVALARTPALTPSTLSQLARILNLSLVDVRLRLNPALPAVLARLPLDQAEELRAALRAEGFLAVIHEMETPGPKGWVTVKRFSLEEEGLTVESSQRASLRVRYAELRLLMRGRKTTTHVEKKEEVEYQRHQEHYHRSIQEVEEKRHQVENFLWVLGKGFRASFTQATQFMGLGEQRSFTVHENLQRLMAELHRRAPHVVRDERFVQQSRFSLPFVDPGRGQELLAELLFQAVDEGLWT